MGEGHDHPGPGDPDGSYFVELCRPDGEPRMPYKQDPLPKDKLDVIERWVKEGAKYDGAEADRGLARRAPEGDPGRHPRRLPGHRPDHRPGVQPRRRGGRRLGLPRADHLEGGRRAPSPGASEGMAERVHDVAYSPDGKWMATASGDPGQFGSVQLWIAEPDGGGKLARDLLETTDSVFAVAFSPDGTKLAAAGADRAVRVWEVATGKELALIEDHADWIFDLAWSPDGKRLATASRDKTSKVFDVEKKESIATFPGHADTVYCRGLRRRRQVGRHRRRRQPAPRLEARRGRQAGPGRRRLRRSRSSASCSHPDGKTLIACGADKIVRSLQRTSTPRLTLARASTDWVYSIALSPGTARPWPPGVVGRRSPPLERGGWQADPDHPRRPRLQAGGTSGGAVRSGIRLSRQLQ